MYDHIFTASEIQGMIAFYESPIGKRFMEVQPQLMKEGMALGQEWGARIGTDVGRAMTAEGPEGR